MKSPALCEVLFNSGILGSCRLFAYCDSFLPVLTSRDLSTRPEQAGRPAARKPAGFVVCAIRPGPLTHLEIFSLNDSESLLFGDVTPDLYFVHQKTRLWLFSRS